MNFEFLALFVRVVAQLFIWVVIASALLSFFLPPFHPVREALGRIVNPFLEPIRRIMPGTGMIDFSPLILIFAVEILSRMLISILLSL
ncbi:MAG: YggT family protein [Anaerolineales bacterium]|jgi:YggT family protein|nr:YggT family protein [Anaerolineales bacterium]